MGANHDEPRRNEQDIAERYRIEREKRLRPDGNAQYQAMSGALADFDADPGATPLVRPAVDETVDVLLIGAGLGALQAAGQLSKLGVTDIRIIDRAADFGGTWYWNRYPGAACDVESYVYMPFLEETGYVPSQKYATAVEIFEHCQRIGEHFDLYPRALFQTVVTDLSWDDRHSLWRVTTDRGDRIAARFAIVAGGIMHKAKLPGIPGVADFGGTSFHAARWNYAYTGGSASTPLDKLHDKRVALIGTGATAVQVLPRLAESAHHVHVFQRTPAGVGVRDNRPTDPAWAASLKPGWQAERVDNFSKITSAMAVEKDLVDDGWTHVFLRNPNAFSLSSDEDRRLDLEAMNAVRQRVEDTVTDPATAEALKPWYAQMCKRPCFHDEYLPSFNRPNVTLVDTRGSGVERITRDAIVVDGVEYPVDCIVYASGFEMGTSYTGRLGFPIHGRGGVSLDEAWSNGPATLLGAHARGFPNLIMFGTTQTVAAINFAHFLGELATHAAHVIRRCMDEEVIEIEPSEEAQENWFRIIRESVGARATFISTCTPSYLNGEGNRDASEKTLRSMPYLGPTYDYFEFLREWRSGAGWERMERATRVDA